MSTVKLFLWFSQEHHSLATSAKPGPGSQLLSVTTEASGSNVLKHLYTFVLWNNSKRLAHSDVYVFEPTAPGSLKDEPLKPQASTNSNAGTPGETDVIIAAEGIYYFF